MPFLSPAPQFMTNEDQTPVVDVRQPTTQYLLLNSANRGFSKIAVPIIPPPPPPAPQFGLVPTKQAWNNFRLQKNEALMTAFARRIQVCEIRFPWSIPNITSYNNRFVYSLNGISQSPIILTPGFYTPAQIVTVLNAAFPAGTVSVTYNASQQKFSFAALVPNTLTITTPYTTSLTNDYYQEPSLALTLGLPVYLLGNTIPAGGFITGQPTNCSYTDYVDIASDKLMTYTDVRDGSSAEGGQSSVIARLYANDEISIPATNPITSAPFYIHRQFKNAKNIKWNSEAVIDWCDIQVYDMYGNLIYLPTDTIPGTSPAITVPGTYPDFQITLLASEQ